jgi:hypothetical protein
MAVNSYTKGTQVRLSATFTVAGVATDPTTVTFKVEDPTGIVTSYTSPQVIKDSVGNYHLDILLGTSGVWWYRTEGSGVVTAATEAQLAVRSSNF